MIESKIYNADCMNILDELIKDGILVDLIATDPPYLVTSRGQSGNSGGMMKKDVNMSGMVFNNNDTHVSLWAPKFYSVLKESGHCYIMTNHKNLHEYLNVLTGVGFIFIKSLIWDKGNKIMGTFYMSQFEYILFFRKGEGIKINNCGTPDILPVPNKKTKDRLGENIHDTEKPIDLMKILIENSTSKGQIVLDPFMGVGSTCIASQITDRIYLGVEIDEKYFNIASKRLAQHQSQAKLF